MCIPGVPCSDIQRRESVLVNEEQADGFELQLPHHFPQMGVGGGPCRPKARGVADLPGVVEPLERLAELRQYLGAQVLDRRVGKALLLGHGGFLRAAMGRKCKGSPETTPHNDIQITLKTQECLIK